jgi:hypothetical protein
MLDSSIKSIHNIEWVCHTCKNHIEEGKIPLPEYCIGNHMKLTEDSQAEVSININIEGGLTNGDACKIMHLDHRVQTSNRCIIVWVLFGDENIGSEQRSQVNHISKS